VLNESEVAELRVTRTLDSKTGRVELKYYWQDEPIQAIELSGVIAERLAGLALIQKDLVSALAWVREATPLLVKDGDGKYQQVEDRAVGSKVKSLYVSALTFYAKCFAAGEGRRAKLDRSDLDNAYFDSHDKVIIARNNVAAHSGAEKLENASTRLLFLPKPEGGFVLTLATNRLQPDYMWTGEEGDQFSALIENAIEKVAEKYHSLGQQIIEAACEQPPGFWEGIVRKDGILDVGKLLQKK
jgi:hypothetical protein